MRRSCAGKRQEQQLPGGPRTQAEASEIGGRRQVGMTDAESFLENGGVLHLPRLVVVEVVDLLVAEPGKEEPGVAPLLVPQRQEGPPVAGVLAYRFQEQPADGIEVVFPQNFPGNVTERGEGPRGLVARAVPPRRFGRRATAAGVCGQGIGMSVGPTTCAQVTPSRASRQQAYSSAEFEIYV